jgi:hypothetical protein
MIYNIFMDLDSLSKSFKLVFNKEIQHGIKVINNVLKFLDSTWIMQNCSYVLYQGSLIYMLMWKRKPTMYTSCLRPIMKFFFNVIFALLHHALNNTLSKSNKFDAP